MEGLWDNMSIEREIEREMDMKDIKTIVYDGAVRLDVRFDGKTVWLSQQQIAELFGVGQAAISKHIKNIYSSEAKQNRF